MPMDCEAACQRALAAAAFHGRYRDDRTRHLPVSLPGCLPAFWRSRDATNQSRTMLSGNRATAYTHNPGSRSAGFTLAVESPEQLLRVVDRGRLRPLNCGKPSIADDGWRLLVAR